MKRRHFITTTIGVGFVALSGCLTSEVDGDVVVDETVYVQTSTFRFDAESGDTINVYLENEQGHMAHILITDPDGEEVLEEEVETEDSFSFEAEASGAFSVHVTPVGDTAEASVEIGVED